MHGQKTQWLDMGNQNKHNSTIMVSVICFCFVFVLFEFYKGNCTSMQHRLLFFQLMGQMHLFQCRLYNFVRR